MPTAIEWTDETWNPTTGCTHVSDGCKHCYAEELSLRRGWSQHPWIKPFEQENVVLHPDRLDKPRHWRHPRRVFVDSMSDLFHELVPDGFLDDVFAVMAATPRHTYQILTKRPERLARYLSARETILPNVWVGTSVEDQRVTDRIDWLGQTPAVVRFLSCEPLIGPLDLTPWLPAGVLHWVIAGGESGPVRRPCDPAWIRSLRDQCIAVGVAFFFKQWGGRTPKARGRELDGRTWDEFPIMAVA